MRIRIHQIAALVLASQAWASDRFPVEAEFKAVDGMAHECPESWAWATPDQGLILYGGRTEHGYRVCPWLAEATRQPFCRTFDAPVRAACGHREQVLLLLANGDIHRVNNALIGSDGDFLPAYHPVSPVQLKAAWLPDEDCDPAGGLPEVFAIGSDGGFVHFDGKAWRPLDELPEIGIAGQALADHATAFIQTTNSAGE